LFALLVTGCAASTSRTEITLAAAMATLAQRTDDLAQARAEVTRARQRNVEALLANAERTRRETETLLSTWRLAGRADRVALFESVRAPTPRQPEASAASAPSPPLGSAPKTFLQGPSVTITAQGSASTASPEAPADTLVPSNPAITRVQGIDRTRLASAASNLAELGTQRTAREQVGTYMRYVQAVAGELLLIELRAKLAAAAAQKAAP
jgi:hypothetical protein